MVLKRTAMLIMAVVMSFAAVFTVTPGQTHVQASSQYEKLEKNINAIIADASKKSVVSSVTVRKASTGEIIYEANADGKVTPASTLKLLTSAAALETLGEEYRFTTDLLTDGSIAKGVLNGNLYLRGQGDPTLMKKDLDQFAATLAKQGVKTITGDLVGDDSWFDSVRLSPGIDKSDETFYYAAQISGLTLSPNSDYDAGTVIVNASPTKKGYKAKVTMTPDTGIITVINKSNTVPKGNKNTLSIKRQHGTNTIIIAGNVPLGSAGKKEWVTVSNPTAYTMDVFKKSLSAKGIKFTKSSKVARRVVPQSATVITSRQSMPLRSLMRPFMKLSNNTHAEILAKTMGKQVYGEGSWNAGLRVMREFGQSVGLRSTEWNFEDASGMSHKNKVTSAQMTELLFAARQAPWYGSFVQGLPVSGMNDRFVGGTLKNRLTGSAVKGKVVAKTGSLNRVNSLAGYAETRDGETLIFSILTQGQKTTALPAIDRIATIITTTTK
ncbi:D-alanyl-D-alanine carboxypeptidase/D-alanyl-D-alanine-endopeptidase [Sporosarcina luteola]|uniref:D-alanyl-D-alanine carboxypeptidase/D-alanyl-D-alanine endopeptidase n=1 Tax=Sporosarcina luteola TaxID=582850 RepID=UPI00203C9A31|nr:D-alanyl-D-alanine carboxypeptidase/D-alanyl-D-alanine-endopeptidase [Sporosarcina luteola]MCM3637537.1 D-alanyl-D-alanine carboxypeptidase/D-alanyl-D-alanine-endopeptidase [Sporosarcina luteola]